MQHVLRPLRLRDHLLQPQRGQRLGRHRRLLRGRHGALALVGLFGKRLRALRVFLGVWVLFGLAGSLDFAHTRVLWNLIPLVDTSSFPRYVMPSCEIAVVVLAGLGFADFLQSARSKRLFVTASVVMLLAIAFFALRARPYNRGVVVTHKADIILIGLDLLPFLALGLLLALGLFAKWRYAPLLIAIVLVGESVVLFFVPTAESPKQITIDYAPIHYLQRHQGEERFLDLAVLYPNWGSEFGLYSLSSIDLPYPRNMKNFIEDELYPGLTPGNQFTVKGGLAGIQALESELAQHFQAYENASVKYLLMNTKVPLTKRLLKLGVKEVFTDSLATIYVMPHTRPFFTTSSSTCTVMSADPDHATVDCAGGGTTLLRTELAMKGWTAFVNGKPATITTVNHVYQRIDLPAGQSTVVYRFYPPHERYALLAGLLGGLFLIGSFVNERHRFVPTLRRPRDY